MWNFLTVSATTTLDVLWTILLIFSRIKDIYFFFISSWILIYFNLCLHKLKNPLNFIYWVMNNLSKAPFINMNYRPLLNTFLKWLLSISFIESKFLPVIACLCDYLACMAKLFQTERQLWTFPIFYLRYLWNAWFFRKFPL